MKQVGPQEVRVGDIWEGGEGQGLPAPPRLPRPGSFLSGLHPLGVRSLPLQA